MLKGYRLTVQREEFGIQALSALPQLFIPGGGGSGGRPFGPLDCIGTGSGVRASRTRLFRSISRALDVQR